MYAWSRPEPPLPGAADQERFWKLVRQGQPDECWPWRTGKKGSFWWTSTDGVSRKALSSRVAYRITHGEIPADHVVAHSCDNPPCCNPAHLVAETQQKNTQDAVDRGLLRYDSPTYLATRKEWWKAGANKAGQSNAFSKLTDEQVLAVRKRYDEGAAQVELAAEFGISQSTVSRIVRRESWTHI